MQPKSPEMGSPAQEKVKTYEEALNHLSSAIDTPYPELIKPLQEPQEDLSPEDEKQLLRDC